MIRFNTSGLVIFLFGALVLTVVAFFDLSFENSAVIGFGSMTLLDLLYRLQSDEEGQTKWLGNKTGGVIGFGPAWIMGLLLIFIIQLGWIV